MMTIAAEIISSISEKPSLRRMAVTGRCPRGRSRRPRWACPVLVGRLLETPSSSQITSRSTRRRLGLGSPGSSAPTRYADVVDDVAHAPAGLADGHGNLARIERGVAPVVEPGRRRPGQGIHHVERRVAERHVLDPLDLVARDHGGAGPMTPARAVLHGLHLHHHHGHQADGDHRQRDHDLEQREAARPATPLPRSPPHCVHAPAPLAHACTRTPPSGASTTA